MSTENNFFPTDPKKIRDTIRRYERAFKGPHYDDGPGKRFLLGPIYLLMGDTPGASLLTLWKGHVMKYFLSGMNLRKVGSELNGKILP